MVIAIQQWNRLTKVEVTKQRLDSYLARDADIVLTSGVLFQPATAAGAVKAPS